MIYETQMKIIKERNEESSKKAQIFINSILLLKHAAGHLEIPS